MFTKRSSSAPRCSSSFNVPVQGFFAWAEEEGTAPLLTSDICYRSMTESHFPFHLKPEGPLNPENTTRCTIPLTSLPTYQVPPTFLLLNHRTHVSQERHSFETFPIEWNLRYRHKHLELIDINAAHTPAPAVLALTRGTTSFHHDTSLADSQTVWKYHSMPRL